MYQGVGYSSGTSGSTMMGKKKPNIGVAEFLTTHVSGGEGKVWQA